MKATMRYSGGAVRWSVMAMLLLVGLLSPAAFAVSYVDDDGMIHLTVSQLPDPTQPSIDSRVAKAFLDAFYDKYPDIRVASSVTLKIEGKTMDMVPLMQIASDTSPDVIYVNFRISDSYIQQNFLYPLDEYIDTLSQEEQDRRIPKPLWPVIKRPGPDAHGRGGKGPEHVWCFPERPLVRALMYRKDAFQEAGLPDRAPKDWNELWEWGKRLTNVPEDRYGLMLAAGDVGSAWDWMSFLWSAGGRAVQLIDDEWRCVFDSREAAIAAVYYTKLIRGPWKDADGRSWGGIVYRDADASTANQKFNLGMIGMRQGYLDFMKFSNVNPDLVGIGPVPMGPTGLRGSEFNCRMYGIYAGQKDKVIRDAAWKWIQFFTDLDGQEAQVGALVENGFGSFVNPDLLKRFGYDEYLRLVPPEIKEAFDIAVTNGKPEPYGKNCQQVYKMIGGPLGAVINSKVVLAALAAGDDEAAIAEAQKHLIAGVKVAEIKMLGRLTEKQRTFRNRVATVAVTLIAIIFFFMFRSIWKVFSPPKDDPGFAKGAWQFRKYKFAYLMLVPAIATIMLWKYYPLVRGVFMAFQDYRVTGNTTWVGIQNFADVLFDDYFLYALWITVKYALTFLALGFFAPIILAILLQEVPKGKIFYRTIYYLPAVIAGLITIFLWKSFYTPGGFGNQILGLFGVEYHRSWLEGPNLALLCIVVPLIWSSMGPGCLLYLAALKTIPDDLYEAANIDGAGVRLKIMHITLPSLKSLIMINFIGAFIAAFQASNNVLAMTGGGPYNPRGATEVVGLQIFYTAYGYMKFGAATAMAWILGLMLIGFTVINLRRLRNMEFRSAASIEKN